MGRFAGILVAAALVASACSDGGGASTTTTVPATTTTTPATTTSRVPGSTAAEQWAERIEATLASYGAAYGDGAAALGFWSDDGEVQPSFFDPPATGMTAGQWWDAIGGLLPDLALTGITGLYVNEDRAAAVATFTGVDPARPVTGLLVAETDGAGDLVFEHVFWLAADLAAAGTAYGFPTPDRAAAHGTFLDGWYQAWELQYPRGGSILYAETGSEIVDPWRLHGAGRDSAERRFRALIQQVPGFAVVPGERFLSDYGAATTYSMGMDLGGSRCEVPMVSWFEISADYIRREVVLYDAAAMAACGWAD